MYSQALDSTNIISISGINTLDICNSNKTSTPGIWTSDKFAIYYPYYKNKHVGNLTRIFVCIINCLYFLSNWSNLLTVIFLTYNSSVCTAEPSPITKKGEPLRTFLYLISYYFQLLSLFFSLIFSEMYLVMTKCLVISKWQLNLTLASHPLLAYYASGKLTYKASFNFFYTTQIVKFLLDNITLLNK